MKGLNDQVTLVIGAGSAIAGQLIVQSLAEEEGTDVVAVSRLESKAQPGPHESRLHWLQSDYTEQSMGSIVSSLLPRRGSIRRVFICNGILQDTDIRPEKRLRDLNEKTLQQVWQVNTIIPILWIKHLAPLLQVDQECIITVFSARVGSIEDNKSGGWYAYRSSKAALNMLLKTAAIEYSRFGRQIHFLAFHPGTVDTPLSKPFQKSVPSEKLFTPDSVAKRLLTIVKNLQSEEAIQYLAWDGEPIAW